MSKLQPIAAIAALLLSLSCGATKPLSPDSDLFEEFGGCTREQIIAVLNSQPTAVLEGEGLTVLIFEGNTYVEKFYGTQSRTKGRPSVVNFTLDASGRCVAASSNFARGKGSPAGKKVSSGRLTGKDFAAGAIRTGAAFIKACASPF